MTPCPGCAYPVSGPVCRRCHFVRAEATTGVVAAPRSKTSVRRIL